MMKTLLLFAAALTLMGCQTDKPEYRLSVTNQGQHLVRDVEVGYAGKVRGSAATLEPKSVRGTLYDGEEVANEVSLRWKDHTGKAHEKLLKTPSPVPSPFDGEVYVRIEDSGNARLYILNERKRNDSLIPWGQPAQWEQAPSIPGLDNQ